MPSHHLEDAASIHNCWEPSQQTHCWEESSSLAVRGLLATKIHHWEESSSLAVRGPLAMMIHHWEASSSLAMRGPLAVRAHRCEESSFLASRGPLAMMISPSAADHTPAHGAEPSCSGDSSPSTTPSSLAGNLALARLRPLPQLADHPPLLILPGPVAHIDVFIDKFIGLTQGSWRRCRNIRRCIMHVVDKVFAQRDADTTVCIERKPYQKRNS